MSLQLLRGRDIGLYEVPMTMSLLGFGMGTMLANFHMGGMLVLRAVFTYHLMVHLSSHLLLSDHQYGFRKGRPCTLQLIDVFDNWTKAIDEGDRIDMAYFEFVKVFDTVPTKGF